jgi:hypothetical protein
MAEAEMDTPQDWEIETPPAAGEEAVNDLVVDGVPADPPATEKPPAADPGEKKPDLPDIEAERRKLEEDRKEINRDAFEVRQLKKKLKEKEAAAQTEDIELTDAQFEQLFEAHGSDPKMQVQIYKQLAKQMNKGTEVKATEAIEIKNLKQQQDSYLATNWPDLAKEDSELRGHLERAKSVLRVEDSPFSDFLAMGSIMLARLPEFIKAAEERGRTAALSGNVEGQRKQAIKDKKSLPSVSAPPARTREGELSESNNYGLSDSQMETAQKNFGFKTPQQFKWYAMNLKSAKG